MVLPDLLVAQILAGRAPSQYQIDWLLRLDSLRHVSIGSLLGGWLSSYLMRRKLSLDASRKICLGVSAACLPLSLLIAVSPLAVSIVFFSFAMLGHQSWSTLPQTLTVDMFPSAIVGSVAGLLGAAGAFGGMLSNLVVGALLTRYHSYDVVLGVAGLLHPLSFVIIRGVHRSTKELKAAINDYIQHHNREPKPFIWHKTADQILDSVARFCKRINDSGH